eukprot:1716822-Pyramimonas_sp.AAC.1
MAITSMRNHEYTYYHDDGDGRFAQSVPFSTTLRSSELSCPTPQSAKTQKPILHKYTMAGGAGGGRV